MLHYGYVPDGACVFRHVHILFMYILYSIHVHTVYVGILERETCPAHTWLIMS